MADILDTDAETKRRKILFQNYIHSPEYQKKIVDRLRVNDACNKHKEARQMTWQLCARPDNPVEGCIFFIENFGWTLDPRPQANPHDLPFILFDYQKEMIKFLIEHIDSGKDGFFEKSRDMGASWLIFCYVPLWYWLFRDGSKFLIGSYKEALVDNRSRDSLFGMIDYALYSLPKWILPKGFIPDKHRNHMKLINPVNFNQITGDTMNSEFGRGGRQTAVLFDELGFWEYAKEAWEACAQVTACRIANSTPHGYNFYALLRNSGIDITTIHWRKHPLKDDQWYEFEKSRSTPEAVAQELDISYVKSLEGRVYPEWDDQKVEHGLFPYDPELPLYVGWDFGMTDDTGIIWAQTTKNGKLRVIDTYKKTGKHIEFFIPFITGFLSMDIYGKYTYTAEEMKMIEEHKNWRAATHFGDPSGRFLHQAADYTVFEILRSHGIIVNFKDEWKVFPKRKSAAKLVVLGGIELNDTPRSVFFDMCMTQAAYPKVRRDGSEEVRSNQPIHNWTSHYRSAFEYLCLGLSEHAAPRTKPVDKFKPNRFNIKRTVGY